jgi:hypothetical protein
VADPVLQLFEEYVGRYAAGERPDVREYLTRAGQGGDELADLVSRFLQWADAPEPDDDAVALAQAWIDGEAPLVALRVRRGITRATVVDTIMRVFKLAPERRKKVERRYHELETGQLDARRADPALLRELATLLEARVADLASWKPRPLAAEGMYFRTDAPGKVVAAAPPAREQVDEVDRLFLGADSAE